ncbi:MAG: hypothetical protein NXI22_13545, partial [bacterium]|nr:hypothetical protein [bacterium]
VALALGWRTEPYLQALAFFGLLIAGFSIRSGRGYLGSRLEYHRLSAEFEKALERSAPFATGASLQNKGSSLDSNQQI